MKRTVTVFLCAAGAALAVAILKALIVSGVDTLPPLRVLIFAASMFGLLAALVEWGVFRNQRPSAIPTRELSKHAVEAMPSRAPQPDPIIERARLRPIVFREICPPLATGLSFYGGIPVGPAELNWPRNKHGGVPLSFIMQWDCAELARQDVTGLLPQNGALYLFADLSWNDFQFVHAQGPVDDWQSVSEPPELPPIFGNGGAYQVPYCSPLLPPESQDVPRLLPKWPFDPIAFSFPAMTGQDQEDWYWNGSDAVAEILLSLEHPEGVPPAKDLKKQKSPFKRPFQAFPHDYATIRFVMAKVLEHLQRPSNWLLREQSEQERKARFQRWREEASQRYAVAAAHDPAASVQQSLSDDMWQWMAGLEPVLTPGWGSLVDECVNVSLGLRAFSADVIPPHLVAVCTERHRLASAYLHEEYPDRRNPEALAAWEQRKAEGTLSEVRSLHAPCPNHMFGPPSYVQGYVEEHVTEMVLLLELSSRQPIGHEFGEGVLQFMIRPSDLREGRFDKAILVASAY